MHKTDNKSLDSLRLQYATTIKQGNRTASPSMIKTF
jgi:hypothetical protein